MRVFLDDRRPTPDEYDVRAGTAREAIRLLQTGTVELISLDHDLGDRAVVGDGYDVAIWIEQQIFENNFHSPEIKIHSGNIPGHEKLLRAKAAIEKMTLERGLTDDFRDYKNLNIEFARDMLHKHGEEGEKAVWGDPENHRKSLQLVVDIGDLANKSILDVGCGYGHLIDYIKSKNSPYLGVDISPDFPSVARRHYPDFNFEHRDIQMAPLPQGSLDYVLASGIFSLAYHQWDRYTEEMLRIMYASCRLGMAASFVRNLIPNKLGASDHVDPSRVLKFASRITSSIKINDAYTPELFAVYFYK